MPSITAEQRSPTLLTEFKQRLNEAHLNVVALHNNGANIEQVVRETAQQTDIILIDAWRTYFSDKTDVSIIAVGGYGRSELNIHSDIDLLFLHAFPAPIETKLEAFGLGDFIQFLWDIGLEVGHSVRSVEECLSLANDDITIMTNMLESRLLMGDEALYQRFETQIREHSSWTNKSFYQAKLAEQNDRHLRFDETTYKLEPNIKKSPGGLRDIQTISWIANKIHGTSDPDSLMALGLLTEDELRLFKDSRNELWQLRNALHVQTKRAEDRLLFEHQHEIAAAYGLKDAPGLMAIEQLMQRYYRAAHEISQLNELIMQLMDEQLHDSKNIESTDLNAHFRIRNGYLDCIDEAVFIQHPAQLIQVFSLFQQQQTKLKGFSARCARAIRQARPLIDDAYRNEPENLAAFLALFKLDKGLTHSLRKIHEYGILGTFLPVFGQIEGQMQHDLFHAYTVDAHTLMVVRNLRRLAVSKHNEELPQLSELMQATQQRYRLYLAALFHDIAKGRGGDHHKHGAVDARAFCEKLGLPSEDVDLISWLVLNHLNMSKVSQREDLSDPQVIQNFAESVQNKTYLDSLYLLTVCDIRGTSTTTWTAWKGHLLAQLYRGTRQYLEQSDPSQENITAEEIEQKKTKTLALLENKLTQNTLEQYWQMFDDDYFLSHPTDTIAWHALAICQASALDLPLVEVRHIPNLEAEQYLIYTADSDVLLSTITGVIDQHNQNIVQARIHEANPGFTVLIITVNNANEPDAEMLDEHRASLRHALLEARDHRPAIKKIIPRRLQQFNVELDIFFSDAPDAQHTILSLTALDQPGLMHTIATALAKCQIQLISAHIATAGEKVEDRFFGLPAK